MRHHYQKIKLLSYILVLVYDFDDFELTRAAFKTIGNFPPNSVFLLERSLAHLDADICDHGIQFRQPAINVPLRAAPIDTVTIWSTAATTVAVLVWPGTVDPRAIRAGTTAIDPVTLRTATSTICTVTFWAATSTIDPIAVWTATSTVDPITVRTSAFNAVIIRATTAPNNSIVIRSATIATFVIWANEPTAISPITFFRCWAIAICTELRCQ